MGIDRTATLNHNKYKS